MVYSAFIYPGGAENHLLTPLLKELERKFGRGFRSALFRRHLLFNDAYHLQMVNAALTKVKKDCGLKDSELIVRVLAVFDRENDQWLVRPANMEWTTFLNRFIRFEGFFRWPPKG